jgi:hypothetical protein
VGRFSILDVPVCKGVERQGGDTERELIRSPLDHNLTLKQ